MLKWFGFIIVILVLFGSCRKDNILIDPNAKLGFSQDTVIFDTVFTTIGSVTKHLKVYNRNNKTVNISTIRLAGAALNAYRLNIDGIPGNSMSNKELLPYDSMYIFIEVTVNPNGGNSPMIITDSIVFELNGKTQDVDLAAWGQDAYFYNYPLICNAVLNNDKPHVFYGLAVVDSACTLTINEGTQLHFHKNSGLILYKESTLKVNGTLDKPVVFQGDRLEFAYSEIPGQWGNYYNGAGIWFFPDSKNNEINYAVIKNGNIGLIVDSLADAIVPKLKLKNTIIKNHAGLSVLGLRTSIEAENCLFANAGQYVAALIWGGSYSFLHCSFANYWKYGNRENPMLAITNYFDDGNTVFINDLKKADFTNCIVYGNLTNEIEPDSKLGAAFEYKFQSCLLKTDKSTSDINHFSNIVLNPPQITVDGELHDPVFNNVNENDFHLFNQSAAINKGINTTAGTLDLDGKTRDAQPDIGAYEFIP